MTSQASLKTRVQRFRQYILYQLMTPVRCIFEKWMLHKNQVVLYCTIGDGIGDALALSTLLRSLYIKSGTRGIVFSKHPQLFWNNPMVKTNLDYDRMSSLGRSLLKIILRSLRGKSVICFGGEVWTLGTSPFTTRELDDDRVPGWVWLTHMVPDRNIDLDSGNAIPAIYFSQQERDAFKAKFSDLPEQFALLKATVGVNRPPSATLKNWDLEKIKEIVEEVRQIQWVQVGQLGEAEIPNTLNLLGKTSVRETLYLLSRAKLILSVEGFLTHAAAAFATPCVVPFTGIHEPQGLLYPNTEPVLPDPFPVCMPCWQSVCTTAGMPCRQNIAKERVRAAILKHI